MNGSGGVAAYLIGKAVFVSVVLALTATLSARDLALIPQEIRTAMGISIPLPTPAPTIISTGNETYIIYPQDIDLTYAQKGGSFEPKFSDEKLRQQIETLAALVDRPPRDAVLNIDDLSVAKDIPGMKLNVESTAFRVYDFLDRAAFDEIVPAAIDEIPAERQAALYEGFDTKPIGEYATRFKIWQEGRNYNIELCASMFNGMIVQPGQEVSFNATTGDRTYSTGYKTAPVIEDQELVPGVGGGSCQVSTTLYNAVCLEAGMPATERWPHGLQVHYVPWNRDATVAYPNRDLKFVNTFDSPLLITSEIIENELTFRVFAKLGATNYVSTELAEISRTEQAKTAPPLRPKPKPKETETAKPKPPEGETPAPVPPPDVAPEPPPPTPEPEPTPPPVEPEPPPDTPPQGE